MAQETVLIDFQVDYSQLTTAQEQLAKGGKVDTSQFKAIQDAISTTATDSKGLIKTFKDVATASVKMGKTVEDAFGAGVQDALDQAGVSAEEFAGALKKANTPAVTLKKEMLQLKEAIARMKAEGKDTGAEFDALRARAGKLADAISDANKEIKNAGSDTRGLDNVVGSISALAGGYAAVQGAAAIFGDENEDLQKTLVKVNGAMALAQGAQVLYNASLKEGALAKLADSVATGTQTAATTLYTFVTSGATVAARIFKATLLATGIGAVVVLVIALVNAMSDYGDETKDATVDMDAFNDSLAFQNELLDTNLKNLDFANKILIEKAKQRGATEKELNDITISGLKEQAAVLRSIAKDQTERLNESLKTGKLSAEAQNKLSDEILANKLKANDLDRQAELTNEQFKTKTIIDGAEKRAKALEISATKLDAQRKKLQADEMAELSDQVKGQLAALDKQEEQLRIHFDNEQEIIAQANAERDALEKSAIQRRLNAEKEAAGASVQIVKDKNKLISDEDLKTINNYIQVAQEAVNLFAAISDLSADQESERIARQKRELKSLQDAGAITDKQAKIRLQQIEVAEKRAKENQAKREKEIATFRAVIAIPQAFLKGLTDGGIYLAAIYAALAAAEAAIIISKPVPKFFRGKKDSYTGPGVVADMGSEIVERGGRMYLYTKPTQTYLGAKDKVYTASETRNILHNTNISTTIKPAKQERFDYNKFAKAIPSSGVNINIDKDFISEAVASGLSKNNYFTNRYQFRK